MNRERSITTSLMAVLLLACASTSALADEDQGLYLGGGYGQFGLEFDDIDDAIGDFDFNDSDSAYKLFAGWRFNPYLSAELDYLNLGGPNEDFDDGTNVGQVEASIDGFAPYVVGTLPLGIFELFAKVGYLFYNVDVDFDLNDIELGDSDNDEAFVYGVGAGLVVFEHLNVRLEYEKFEISNTDNADAFWLTAAWRF